MKYTILNGKEQLDEMVSYLEDPTELQRLKWYTGKYRIQSACIYEVSEDDDILYFIKKTLKLRFFKTLTLLKNGKEGLALDKKTKKIKVWRIS